MEVGQGGDPEPNRSFPAKLLVLIVLLSGVPVSSRGQTFTLSTPAGPVTVEVSHAGPSGSLVSPAPPEPLDFRPPSIFSAPLPSGSGARALGLAGAFTALADDATAASWNPAGLIQLERPELSVVYRFDERDDTHLSDDPLFNVGEDSYEMDNLNYFSAAYPFYIESIQRNAVVSFNYQEAYDFTTEFNADTSGSARSAGRGSSRTVTEETQVDVFKEELSEITVTTFKTTTLESMFEESSSANLLSDIAFDQDGVVSALTPAFALEITPKLYVGGAFNYYRTDPLGVDTIRSKTVARYNGRARSSGSSSFFRETRSTYELEGSITIPVGGLIPFPIVVEFEDSGEFESFSESGSTKESTTVEVDGEFVELNEYKDFEGYNATFGVLYTVNRLLGFGASVDLPWTADTEQTKTTRSTITTLNGSRTRVLDKQESEVVETKDVEFDFPLFWSAGVILRWTHFLYTTFDVSQTLWSDFAFQAEGDPEINPLDGRPTSESEPDDTWAYRVGSEYLYVADTFEIPIRVGYAWEERPAIDQPDEFESVSVGTGIAFGKGLRKTIIDVAYVYTWCDDVASIVPDRPGITTEVDEHQVFLSLIQHF